MTSNIINQENYTAYQPSLLLDFNFSFDKDVDSFDLSVTVLEILREINLNKFIDFHNYDTRSYDPVILLSVLLLAFSEDGYCSLRDLEKRCRYDLRYRIICGGLVPSYKTFERFINQRLKMTIDEIAKEIYLFIQNQDALEKDVLYVDGTKFEANANKMTFCWRGWSKRYLPLHWKKTMECLRQVNTYFKKNNIDIQYSILKKPSIEYMIEIDEALERWLRQSKNIRKGKGKHPIAKLCDELKKKAMKLWQYAMQEDILENRNSFSKSDPDATFMHMKYDYYNHTGVFKPGYNVQVAVNNGYIAAMFISEHANDMKTLQPFMEQYKKMFNHYPKVIIGDAGYGSFDNYNFCKLNQIEGVLKYSGYEKKKEKINDKNRYRLSHMKRLTDGTPICPEGHAFSAEKVKIEYAGIHPKISVYYQNKHCNECTVKSMCTKAKGGRSAQVVPALQKMHEEIDELLETKQGKEWMSQRSVQAEGCFGDIKQNFEYTRLKRRGESGVKVELYLVSIGYNIRKYHNHKTQNHRENQKAQELMN